LDLGLHGRIALVTGASGGIGAATARLLATEGAHVVVAYHRDAAAAEAVAADVRAAGRRAWCVALDMSDAADVQRAVAEVGTLTGGILDIAVLNAGQNILTPLETLEPDEWDAVVRTNLNGTFYLLRAVRPLLRTGSAVVTVASVAANTGAPHHAHYAAAKAGIVNLTKSAARDLAPTIRVNCVSPGLTRTTMGENTVAGAAGNPVAKLLAGRMAEPEEIARMIVFLASPAASFVYGATFDVNGGRDLR
jgi:3-oxoacyl-[acyl-carrier protein] reductase